MNRREFNTGEPIAYLITWSTYGTWLPGDERGWNRKGEPETLPADKMREELAYAEMKELPFLLSETDRKAVEETVRKHCEIRNWELHAVNARSNHVHVVVTASGYQPDTVARQFKAWCTRRLKREHPGRKKFWTEGASRRWINHEDDLVDAALYTLEAQDRKANTSPTRQRVRPNPRRASE